MMVKISEDTKKAIEAYVRKTGVVNKTVAVNNIVSAILDLDDENRKYLHDACMARYDELNSIDVEDGDIEKDQAITEKMRQMLYASFVFRGMNND